MKNSATALITYNKKILMLLRDNKPEIPDPNCWQLIGGQLESNETPIEALIREVREESNLEIKKNEPILIGEINFLGKKKIFLYWIKLSKAKAREVKLGNEGQEIAFFSIKELEKLNLGLNTSNYFKKFKKGLKNIVENEVMDKKALGF